MAEILIVDDERVLREGMKARLQAEGYDVRTAKDGDDALVKIAERAPDLVLLDIMMPKTNGFRCCEAIRKTNALLPIVFLTAKDAEGDQVRGLGLGADDYVSKSAPESVLLARIGAALERTERFGANVTVAKAKRLLIGPVEVDRQTFAVLLGGKAIATLTKTEADVLAYLFRRRGELVLIDDIIAGLRGSGYACEDSMVYAHVSRLRRKLGPAGALVRNIRRAGYTLLPA